MESNDVICAYLSNMFGENNDIFPHTNRINLNETDSYITQNDGLNHSISDNSNNYSNNYSGIMSNYNEFREIKYYLLHFVMPGLCFFGIIGNLFNIIVVSSGNYCRQLLEIPGRIFCILHIYLHT